MENVIGILGALIVFGAIIVFHEFGHFIVAKLSGMKVHEFSVGMGPLLFKIAGPQTQYSLRAVPIGGFVRVAGMDLGEEDDPRGFDKKPFGARFATIVAGSLMNFVLALVVLVILGMCIGRPADKGKTAIGGVMPDTPAARAGLRAGDRIVNINGVRDPDVEIAVGLIGGSKPPVRMVIERGGERLAIEVAPELIPGQKSPKIGVELRSVDVTYRREGAVAAVGEGLRSVYDATRSILLALAMLVTGKMGLRDVAGPVGITRIIHGAAKAAFFSPERMSFFLSLFALISINIGIINLLPIPALDGSRLVFIAIGQLRGKPIDKEKEALVHLVGFAVLLALIVLITIKDILAWRGAG